MLILQLLVVLSYPSRIDKFYLRSKFDIIYRMTDLNFNKIIFTPFRLAQNNSFHKTFFPVENFKTKRLKRPNIMQADDRKENQR